MVPGDWFRNKARCLGDGEPEKFPGVKKKKKKKKRKKNEPFAAAYSITMNLIAKREMSVLYGQSVGGIW